MTTPLGALLAGGRLEQQGVEDLVLGGRRRHVPLPRDEDGLAVVGAGLGEEDRHGHRRPDRRVAGVAGGGGRGVVGLAGPEVVVGDDPGLAVGVDPAGAGEQGGQQGGDGAAGAAGRPVGGGVTARPRRSAAVDGSSASTSLRRRLRPRRGSPTAGPARTGRRATPSGLSSTHTRPPWMVMCSATSARPSPTPSTSPRWRADVPRLKRWKMRSRSLLGHAGPVVLHRDLHVAALAAQLDPGGPVAVLAGVVEQVGDHRGPGAACRP